MSRISSSLNIFLRNIDIIILYVEEGPVLRTTTKKRQYFVRSCCFSSFCRRFRRFVVVFFNFISFRRFSRLLSVRNDRFVVVFLSFLTLFFFQLKLSFFYCFFVVFCRFLRRFFVIRNRRFLIVFSSFNCSWTIVSLLDRFGKKVVWPDSAEVSALGKCFRSSTVWIPAGSVFSSFFLKNDHFLHKNNNEITNKTKITT